MNNQITGKNRSPSKAHGYERDMRYDWQREIAGQDDVRRGSAVAADMEKQQPPGRRKTQPSPSPSRYSQNRRRKRKRGARHTIAVILRIFLCLLLVCCIAGGIWGYITVSAIIKDAPALTAAAVTPTEAASYIYDADGQRDLKLTLPEANRDLVSIQNVPLHLQHAFVAIEDSRFYTHRGIDPRGILRAFAKGVTSGHFSEGASTITQQLIKNSVLTGWTQETTFEERLRRKIQEQFLALQLEKMLSKDQILQDYMNTINLGAGCYGVQSAAYRYFGKQVGDLTLSESAVIAGITQNPTRYNPITNPENNADRRETVLQAMYRQEYISSEELAEALADDVYARIQSNEDPAYSTNSIYSSYQDALISQVIEDLQTEKDFSYKQAVKAVYSGGLKIYSAQDEAIQQIMDEEISNDANYPAHTKAGIDYALSVEAADGAVTHYGNEHLRTFVRQTQGDAFRSFDLLCDTEEEARQLCERFRDSVVTDTDTVLGERITITPQPQASMVLIDQATGYVKAIAGGRGEKSASLTLNRAVSTLRQPGSTFKILSAFAPALESWGKSLASSYDNTAYSFSDGTPVRNWDAADDAETVTMREAIIRSVNIAAVRCLTEITPQAGYEMLLAFGFTTLEEGRNTDSGYITDIGQALVLGGLTNGVTNLELCAAYAAIANEGIYLAPTFYTKVEDASGEVLLDHTVQEENRVISASTAWLLTDAMQDVITDPEGTGYGYIDTGTMASAGKSGTTSSYKDVWFTGYTPYYTLSVWGGYDNNTGLGEEASDHSYDKVLWNAVMNRIDEELRLSAQAFKRPAEIINMSICRDSGMVAVDGCDAYMEYFTLKSQPLNYCPVHGSGLYVSRGASETDQSVVSVVTPETDNFSAYGTDTDQATLSAADQSIVIYTQDSASIPEAAAPAPAVSDPAAAESSAPAVQDTSQPDIVILN